MDNNIVKMGSIPNLSILKGPSRNVVPNVLHRLFESQAKSTPDNIAIYYEESGETKSYTYAEVDSVTNRLARCITGLVSDKELQRNKDGDYIVAVSLQPSDRLVLSLLAIFKAGAAYLPVDPAFPGQRIEHIISEAQPVLVLCHEDSEHFLGTERISESNLFEKSANMSDAALEPEQCLNSIRDDLAIVLYTSGSTGVPKGVRLPHKVIINRLQWQFKTFPYSASEKVGIFKTALTFVDSVSEIWGPLINGLAIVVVQKSITTDPEKLVDILDKYMIERLVLVPSLLRSLLMYLELKNSKSSALAHLKTWVCSGESLAVSLAADFFKFFSNDNHQLCNFYGSTEVMGDVSYHIISNAKQLENQAHIPIGAPIDNTILYLLDKDSRPVKAGECGELFISGANLAAGYVNGRDPDKFVDNPLAVDPAYARLFKTGDFARVEKASLIFEGRTDSQIKIRGHRVDLSEVERAVVTVAGVEKAIVLCYMPGELNQTLLAFVTTNALVGEQQIESALRVKLSNYMVPQVIIMEAIPLLVNGKIDRQALLKSYENTNNNDDSCFQADIDFAGVQPEHMNAAKVLFETVASVLNRSARSTICVRANFYEIGGNSLNSIFTVTRLNEKGYHISIGDFISAIDFAEILQRLAPATEKIRRASISEPSRYTPEFLRNDHKLDVINMITTSFHRKADLEYWLKNEIFESDYTQLINAIWEPLVEKRLSVVARNGSGRLVGVALNFDARDEPDVEITSRLQVIFEYLESIEGPVRDNQLPAGKNVALHSFMMGTHSSLEPKDNVAVIKFLEDQVIRIANERKFRGIFTSNTNPLTQQLGSDVYGYKTLFDSQVNTFTASDNKKPFGLAPDSQRVLVQWKEL